MDFSMYEVGKTQFEFSKQLRSISYSQFSQYLCTIKAVDINLNRPILEIQMNEYELTRLFSDLFIFAEEYTLNMIDNYIYMNPDVQGNRFIFGVMNADNPSIESPLEEEHCCFAIIQENVFANTRVFRYQEIWTYYDLETFVLQGLDILESIPYFLDMCEKLSSDFIMYFE